MSMLYIFAFCLGLALSYPTEQPTKFHLGTVGSSKGGANIDVSTMLEQGQELLGRVADMIRIGRGRVVNSLSLARNIVAAELNPDSAQSVVAPVLSVKSEALNRGIASLQSKTLLSANAQTPYTRETVKLENAAEQGILEKKPPKPVERILENFLRPTPLVDGIKEEEKYGNSGDKFYGFGRAIVGGFEGLSNFLNVIAELPSTAFRTTTRGISETLNQIGARIVGLQ